MSLFLINCCMLHFHLSQICLSYVVLLWLNSCFSYHLHHFLNCTFFCSCCILCHLFVPASCLVLFLFWNHIWQFTSLPSATDFSTSKSTLSCSISSFLSIFSNYRLHMSIAVLFSCTHDCSIPGSISRINFCNCGSFIKKLLLVL